MTHDNGDVLPQGWAWTTLGNVATVVRGVTYEKSSARATDSDGYIPILRAHNIQELGLDTETELVYVPKIYVNGDQVLEVFDVVVCTSSGSKQLVGKAAPLLKKWYGSFGAFCAVVRIDGELDRRFIAYFLRSDDYRSYIRALSSGVNINNLRRSDLENVAIPLAPLNEQRRIVEAIETQFTRLDAGIAALQRLHKALKRYKAAVLKAACEGQLVPQDPGDEPAGELLKRILAERRQKWEADQRAKGKDPAKLKYEPPVAPDTSDLPELPSGWVWASVEQVGAVQLGRQRSPDNRSKDYPTKYLRAANITEQGLDLSDILDMEFTPEEQARYRLRKGDIVLSEASGSPDQVGKPAIWNDEIDNCCFQNTVIRLRPHSVSSEYINLLFRFYYLNGTFAKVAAGVGINHLSAGKFARISIPIAPENEQSRILKAVEAHLSVIEFLSAELKHTLKRAERLRQSILREAFAGRLVAQDPHDEPASALLERVKRERSKRG